MERLGKKYNPQLDDLKGEVWKKVPETLDDRPYFISNKGRLRSKDKIITLQLNQKTGYYQGMTYIPQPKLLNIHRYVALLFLPEPQDENMVVSHKNGDNLDNRVENLMWAKEGRKRPKRGEIVYDYIVKQMTLRGFVVGTFNGFDVLDRQGFKRSGIMAASAGRSHLKDVYKGYKWDVKRIRKR